MSDEGGIIRHFYNRRGKTREREKERENVRERGKEGERDVWNFYRCSNKARVVWNFFF